jgi:ribosomal protein S18 acetylase RimI-like enzyme
MGGGAGAVTSKRGWLLSAPARVVVDTNTTAVRLYESLGFVPLGTAPGAFRHPIVGPVGPRIMWLDLRDPANATG